MRRQHLPGLPHPPPGHQDPPARRAIRLQTPGPPRDPGPAGRRPAPVPDPPRGGGRGRLAPPYRALAGSAGQRVRPDWGGGPHHRPRADPPVQRQPGGGRGVPRGRRGRAAVAVLRAGDPRGDRVRAPGPPGGRAGTGGGLHGGRGGGAEHRGPAAPRVAAPGAPAGGAGVRGPPGGVHARGRPGGAPELPAVPGGAPPQRAVLRGVAEAGAVGGK
mmetsp:Transcript_48594/g.128527  ORF Transcript_48594/g.128527 Transcript_48594/m.128527 type:complete len:216 (+) Transcript_48594:594-1241(+)